MFDGFYNQSALLTMSSCVILKRLLELFLGVKEGGGGKGGGRMGHEYRGEGP